MGLFSCFQLKCVAAAMAFGLLGGAVMANGYHLRERLHEGVPTAAVLTPGEGGGAQAVSGRVAKGPNSLLLLNADLHWALEVEGDAFIEFWLSPDHQGGWPAGAGWDGVSAAEVTICRFIRGGVAYRLYKAAGESVLRLDTEGGESIWRYPVYHWTRANWSNRNWHYLNIGLSADAITLAVDGFPAQPAGPSPRSPGRLTGFTLAGGPGTAYADLHIVAGAAPTGDRLRTRYRTLYRGQPLLHKPTVTVPWIADPPSLDAPVNDEHYAAFATLPAFKRARSGSLSGSYEGSGIAGYVGYDDENFYLALATPYAGELTASHWGYHDAPVWREESYEIFVCPPWTGTPDYVQLVGNPYGDTADLMSADLSWNGRWFWEGRIEAGRWCGVLQMPFAGVNFPNPGRFDVWTMNLFNSRARIAWNPASTYQDHQAFGTLRFDRDAPVVRPGALEIAGGRARMPIQILGRGPARELTVEMEVFGAQDILPAVASQKIFRLAEGESAADELVVEISDIPEGILAVSVRAGDDLLYYQAGDFPFAEPVTRPPSAPAPAAVAPPPDPTAVPGEPKELTEEEAAYARQWSAEELGRELLAMPEWHGSNLGRSDQVMAPWTPLEVSEQAIHCWGRTYRYDQTLFPVSMRSLDEELLSGAPTLELTSGGVVYRFREGQVELTRESEVLVRAVSEGMAGPFTVRIETAYEFDGMAKVTLRLAGPPDLAAERLELVFPIADAKSRLFHYIGIGGHPPSTDAGYLPAEGLSLDQFRPLVWLGDTRTGFCWFAEGMKHWPIKDEEGIQVIRPAADGGVGLRVKLADKPFAVGVPLEIVFGMQATPTRPRKEEWRRQSDRSTMDWQWFWGDGQYYPFQKNPEPARRHVAARRAMGREVMPCSSLLFYGQYRFFEGRFGLIEDPGLMHRENLLWGALWRARRPNERLPDLPVMPERHTATGDWFGKKFQPLGIPRFCAASSFQDYYLWRLKKLVDETGLGALYLDQPTEACGNYRHGCGYINYRGEWSAAFPIFAMRDMIKRIRQVLYDAHGDARIRFHMSNQILVPVLSLSDTFWDGENYKYGPLRVGEFYSETLSEGRMLAQHIGLPFGFAPDLLPEFSSTYAPSPASVRDMLGMFWVHDSNVSPMHTAHNLLVQFLQGKRLSYPLDKMAVAYFWDENEQIQCDTAAIRYILHYDREQALLILFNWSAEVVEAEIALSPEAIFGAGATPTPVLTDALTGEQINHPGPRYRVPVAPRDFRMLEVRP
ncbi:MAG: DUF6067 family protein [Candidatus Marinimicrobia bacterium]|nr:DUF6067 family protein [Candidatus Neomarinimicrobiota bacterium]